MARHWDVLPSRFSPKTLHNGKLGHSRSKKYAISTRSAGRTRILVLAHGGYLINLASPNPDLLAKSRASFREEMDRAEELEIPYLIVHPGAHGSSGEDAGLNSIIQSLDTLLKSTAGYRVSILVENTAGQGTSLGYSFDHLSRIIQDSTAPERIGICLDTCHAFAAGYDMSEASTYEGVMQELDAKIGLDRLKAAASQ